MMADTVEAASRSLPEYNEESISKLVNKLIDAVRMAGPEQRDIVQYLETIRNAGVGKALREPSTARSSSSKAFYGLMQRP